MSLLPDISREPKIVSGKENSTLMHNVANSLQATNISYDTTQYVKDSDNKTTKVVIQKKQPSFSGTGGAFPNLIFNDKQRSTAYQRLARSSDFVNVKNSPLATRLVYNWKHVERLPTKVVEAKVKVYKPAKRISQQARPPSPYRVKSDWETSDPTFHNEKRTLEMKRMQYLKEHTTWSVYPYAAIEEREQYNKKIRETLKEQIEQKDKQVKKEMEEKILEYQYVSQQDMKTVNEDKKKKIEKFKYLNNYVRENKQLMEDRWMNEYLLKRHEWQQESILLQQDPINWSKTLR